MAAATEEDSPRGLHRVGPEEALRSVAFALVRSMSLERQNVFALSIGQGLPYPEIARRLGLAEDVIKQHLRNGLTSVRRDVVNQLAVLGGPSISASRETIDATADAPC